MISNDSKLKYESTYFSQFYWAEKCFPNLTEEPFVRKTPDLRRDGKKFITGGLIPFFLGDVIIYRLCRWDAIPRETRWYHFNCTTSN